MDVFQNTFVSGDLDPALAGRIDLQAYFQGAASLDNFVVKSSGALTKRMGTDHLRTLTGIDTAYVFPVHKSREEAFIGYLTPAANGRKGKIVLLLSSAIINQLDETAVGAWRDNTSVPFNRADYIRNGDTLTPEFEEAYRAFWSANSDLQVAIPVSYADAASAAKGESYGVMVGKRTVSTSTVKWAATTNAHLLVNEPGGFGEGSKAFTLQTKDYTTKIFVECPGAISEIHFNPINPDYVFTSEESIPNNQPITANGKIVVAAIGETTTTQTKTNAYINPSSTPDENAPVFTLPANTKLIQIYKETSTAVEIYEMELYTKDVDFCVSYNIPITIYGTGWFRYRNTNAAKTLEHDYTAAELSELTHVQSGDTVFFFHPNHDTLMLQRFDDYDWELKTLLLDTLPPPPSGLKRTPSGFAAMTDYTTQEQKYIKTNTVQYAVSAIYPGKESAISAPVSIEHYSSWTQGAKVVLNWTAPVGEKPAEYNVWKKTAGMWGWIGSADGTTFTDTNISPSYQFGVPNTTPVFSELTAKPGVCTFFEQRMVLSRFGEGAPHTLAFSAVGDIYSFFDHTPVTEADAFMTSIASTEHAAIRWIVPQQSRLVIFTESCEYIAEAASSNQGFSGLSSAFRLNTRYGVHPRVPPLSTGGNLLFVRADARSVIDYGYEVQRDAMRGADRNVLSRHLLEGDAITSMAYQQSPDSVFWFTTRKGKLLSLTYQAEHQVYAWSRHTLAGGGEAVEVLASGAAMKNRDGSVNYDCDELYVIVRRSGVLHIERLRPGITSDAPDLRDRFALDSAHILESETVAPTSPLAGMAGVIAINLATGEKQILAEGWAASQFRNLDHAVMIGLPVTARLTTLRPEPPEGSLTGREKRVRDSLLRLRRCGHLLIRNAAQKPDCRVRETYKDALFTGDARTAVDGLWDFNAQVTVVSPDESPAEILAILYGLEVRQ